MVKSMLGTSERISASGSSRPNGMYRGPHGENHFDEPKADKEIDDPGEPLADLSK